MQAENRTIDLTGYPVIDIAIISDTHGNLADEIVDLVAQSDVVLHAGDIMGDQVLRSLKPRMGRVIAVRGNNDFSATWKEDDHDVLSQIPESITVRCEGGDIAMEHGHKVPRIETDHFSLAYKYPDARVVVYGHTHVQRADTDTLPWLVNPGAAGFTRTGGGPSCARLKIDRQHWALESFRFAQLTR